MNEKDNSVDKKLSEAIKIQTQSASGASAEQARFKEYHDFLEKSFPLFHKTASKEIIRKNSLIFIWKGKSKKNGNLPFALLAHQDTVGIEEGTETYWSHPPFDGVDDGNIIWGRGAIDDKCSLIGLLEAAEQLISEGYEPDRDIYFCFGENEETMSEGDASGAGCIASTLKDRGIRFEFVLDEGGVVITDSFMGLKKPLATIGLTEKGYADIRLTVEDEGGHSSEPPKVTAVSELFDLITRLMKINDKNIVVTNTIIETMETIGENKGGVTGFIMKHPKIFFPLIKGPLLKVKQTAAMLRTTIVPTVLRAGEQPNAIPQKAQAILNVRLLAGDDKSTVEDRIKEAAGDHIKYKIEYLKYTPPLPETSSNTLTYKLLSSLAAQMLGAIPLPYMVTGGTDSRHYKIVTDEIYRFYPFAMSFEILGTMHNTDERIEKKSFYDGIEFYKRFIEISGKNK